MKTHPSYFSAHSPETDNSIITLGHTHTVDLEIRMSSNATDHDSQLDLGLKLLPWASLVLLQAGSLLRWQKVEWEAPLFLLPLPTGGASRAG